MSQPIEILVRPATAKDIDFLRAMTVEAAYWDPSADRPSNEMVLSDPNISRYIDGFRRAGDFGLIAESEEREPVGAAWFRFFSHDDPAYGYVADDVPEVAIAVVAAWRGKGVGDRLLRELAACAHEAGLGGLSLSVSNANPARRLYERLGYRKHSFDGDSTTMLLNLGAPPE